MINLFDDNINKIFSNKILNNNIDFIASIIEDQRIQDLLKSWPNDLKKQIVEKYLLIDGINYKNNESDYSWSEYYEMYDGKFDEINMLHITIKKKYIDELHLLGYREQEQKNNWQKPQAGFYKFNEQGNMIIIHSCPDREIFAGDLKQHLEELGIKIEWTIETTLTVI